MKLNYLIFLMFGILLLSPVSAWTAGLSKNLSIYFDLNSTLNIINNQTNNITIVTGSFNSSSSGCLIGNCSNYNMSQGKQKILNSTNLSVVGNFSFNIWFKSNSTITSEDIIVRCADGDTCASGEAYISIINYVLTFRLNWVGILRQHNIANNNQWYMLTYTHNDSNSSKIYLNGTLLFSGDSAFSYLDGAWFIGGYIDGTEMWNGSLDEFGIKN
jgi:hypothetical protein